MRKKKSDRFYKEPDDGTYRSESSLDNPPKGETEEQGKLFDEADSAEKVVEFLCGEPADRMFGVDLKLTLKPGGDGKAITIPLLAGEFTGSRVNEMLGLAITSRRNRKLIDAALDLPSEIKRLVNGIEKVTRTSELSDVGKVETVTLKHGGRTVQLGGVA